MSKPKFITVHWKAPMDGDLTRTIKSSINIAHIRSVNTQVGSENCYCLVDGVEVKESYEEVMKMIKEVDFWRANEDL